MREYISVVIKDQDGCNLLEQPLICDLPRLCILSSIFFVHGVNSNAQTYLMSTYQVKGICNTGLNKTPPVL